MIKKCKKKSATNNIYCFIFTAPKREVSCMRKCVKKTDAPPSQTGSF